MTHPLDHDADGRKGGSLPASQRGKDELYAALDAAGIEYDKRWGRARLEALLPEQYEGLLTVIIPNVIFDGEGGFYPVGHKFAPADEYAAKVLVERGFAK